jgi:hypothetical protein
VLENDDDKTRTYVPLTSGTMVSHYRIVEKIGAGGNLNCKEYQSSIHLM